ncbi:pantetheine-phosphate adenylyltransferase [Thiovibrio frasassiensis]|jgi:pantetheine-phosphate adenylyltransferase|uniref:Phosphopantetheine adenylyltransferase n=1 Tax=Thiovibrio frasassiensis TaxID=2984131 RepID=A0A9X4RLZ1_9BACT|nr:pantetheine-phosphate adenylyltransferase [Thiovibrio frasassiensis]MDG4476571.1 pantetheine-phosphate adenylyltransferase [Thiovibrio frasassiensis]
MTDYEPFVSEATSESVAVYPGTFDPITNGHLDIIHRGLTLFDRVIIAVASNPGKQPLFSLAERKKMIEDCFSGKETRVEVVDVSGLLVDFAYKRGAKAIIRGLRAVSDFDYEFQLALMNRRIEREVETVFLMTGFRWIFISSSIIKDAARHGGDVSGLVPDHVCEKLRARYLQP